MKRDLASRLERLEREADPNAVTIRMWTVENGVARNLRTGEQESEAEHLSRPGRFTFELDTPALDRKQYL